MNNKIIATIAVFFWSLLIFNTPGENAPYNTKLIYDWYKAFSLPIWSIMTIGIWHDIGRDMWMGLLNKSEDLPTRHTTKMWAVFSIWMSFICAWIIQIHVLLYAVPMILILVVFSSILSNWLTMDWTNPPTVNTGQLLSIIGWAIISYPTYYVLNTLWILTKVHFIDSFGGRFFLQ